MGRGKIDGKILYHGIRIPMEIKSMHPDIFKTIDTVDDLRKKTYQRKYLRQLTMYCYGNNEPEGIFILTDCLGHWKILVLTLDYGEAEQALQRLERVHEHLKAGTQPDRIQYREDICKKCPFMIMCLPDIKRDEIQILQDEDLVANLETRETLGDAASAWDKADKWVKKFLKGNAITKGLAGDFVIESTTRERKERITPAGIEVRYTIRKMGQGPEAEQ